MERVTIRHAHVFCGIGGGAKGFNRGEARVGNLSARFECLGGIDVDAAACRDFARQAGAPATCRDLFTREQYVAFHGREPPAGWREATPADIRRAFGAQRPHILFLSAPCKGFSGLLSEKVSRSARYQALNGLTLRGVWLALEAYKDDLSELILFENVPRIATRGRHLLDQIIALLRAYGYAVAETAHDCGELGNLGQSRKRFLLVARHAAKVPGFLYEPIRRPLRGVGEVIGALPVPLPGSERWNPMHRMPALSWKTWVRLAFVEAGSDWRSLNKLAVEGGMLRDFAIAPDAGWHGGVLGVQRWDETSPTVTSRSGPTNGAHAVADPRVDGHVRSVQLGVRGWDRPAGVVTGKMFAGGGPNAVADPRLDCAAGRDFHAYRIVRWDEATGAITAARSPGGSAASVADPRTGFGPGTHHHVLKVTAWDRPGGTITASHHPSGGALCVSDPRVEGVRFNSAHRVVGWTEPSPAVAGPGGPAGGLAVADARAGFARGGKGKYRVTGFDEPAGTVIAASTTGQGACAVADPRAAGLAADRAAYRTGGHYGVVPWDASSGAVTASGQHDSGRWSVADPRSSDPDPLPASEESVSLPAADDRLVCVIRALDGTWHRPFTTLELAALQGLIDPHEQLELDGLSDSAWRERIGNCVPPPSAQAVAGVMGRALLLAWSGEVSAMSCEPVWVRPVVAALMAGRQDAP